MAVKMTLSSPSRFVGLALAVLLPLAGVECLVYSSYLRHQRSLQVASALSQLTSGSVSEITRLQEDIRIIAPGSVVYMVDPNGHVAAGETGVALPEVRLTWAQSCTSQGQTPCIQGNLVASAISLRTSGHVLVIVAMSKPRLGSLILWVFGIALVASTILGASVYWLIDKLFRRPLIAALESTNFSPSDMALASLDDDSGSHRRVLPPLRTSQRLLRPDETISCLARQLRERIHHVDAAWADLASREKAHLEWVAYLSHDLATPLARMLRRVEMIQFDSELKTAEKESTLEQIHRDITELAEIVGSISQFAILDSRLVRSFVEMPLRPLLEFAVEGFEYEASSKGVELDLRVGDDLGTVRIERSLVKRAVENLISNAICYTPEGGLVSVSATQRDQIIQITVEDTGTGVPVQELERVFNFAFRGEGQTRISRVGSLGLGLALVRRVAELHSGTVAASNVAPHGARFVFSLPVVN